MNRTYYKDVTFSGTLSTTNNFGNKVWFDTDGSNLTYFNTGDQSTSNTEDYYVEVDLGSIKPVDKIIIYWDYSDDRQYYRLVKYSTDGSNWTYLIGSSETFVLGPSPGSDKKLGEDATTLDTTTNMRYIRIYGNGNTQDIDNSMYFVRVQRETDTNVSSGDPITRDTVEQTYDKLQDLYSWGQLTAYETKGWTSVSEPSATYPSKSDIDNLRSKIAEYKGSSITWSGTITADETVVSAGIENELNTETNTVGSNISYADCDTYVSCTCDSTCDSVSCSCNGSCYSYSSCSCNNTCYSYSCSCNEACDGYSPSSYSCRCNSSCDDYGSYSPSISTCTYNSSNRYCHTDNITASDNECGCYSVDFFGGSIRGATDNGCKCYNGKHVYYYDIMGSDECSCYTVDNMTYNQSYCICYSAEDVNYNWYSSPSCSCNNKCYGYSCSCNGSCYSYSCPCNSSCDGYVSCTMCHSVSYTV